MADRCWPQRLPRVARREVEEHYPQRRGRALLRARLRVIFERRDQPLGDLRLVRRVAKGERGERVGRVLLRALQRLPELLDERRDGAGGGDGGASGM